MTDDFRNRVLSLLSGTVIFQAFFTCFVYQSNESLFRRLSAVSEAGYLTVPHAGAMARLADVSTAFYGALFFTFSLGTAFCLFSLMMMVGGVRRKTRPGRILLAVFCLVWGVSVVMLMRDGVHAAVSASLIIVPGLIFFFTRNCGKDSAHPGRRNPDIWAAVGVSAVLLSQVFLESPAARFIDIRDGFLLSGGPGRPLNDFYYRYTLFPAEAVKALHQKQIRTCRISDVPDGALQADLADALCADDYLVVSGNAPADLLIRGGSGGLTLYNADRAHLHVGVERFFSDTEGVLKAFSLRSDNYRRFRRYVAGGLLVSLSAGTAFFFFAAFRVLGMLFRRKPLMTPMAAAACVACAVLLMALAGSDENGDAQGSIFPNRLASARPEERIAGLKEVVRRGDDIARFPAYRMPPATAGAAERYWAVRALGRSGHIDAYRTLWSFRDDPHPNVQCVFLEALGRLGDKKDIPVILRKIDATDNWYVQWYAYRALKEIGWRQQRST